MVGMFKFKSSELTSNGGMQLPGGKCIVEKIVAGN